MTEQEMLLALERRDESVISQLEAHCGRLCRMIARNILASDEDVEECINDTWMRIWETVPPISPESLASYAGMLVRAFAIDRYRANHAAKRQALLEPLDELDELIGYDDNAICGIEDEQLLSVINEFILGLDRDSRIIFVRRYYYNDLLATIAGMLGTSEGNARVKLHRTRKKLRLELERRKIL